MLGSELTPIGVHQQAPFGDADERIMRFIVVALREERLVGGNKRNVMGVSELNERGLGAALGCGAVALQLDVEAVAEQARQCCAAITSEITLAGSEGRIERPAWAPAQRDQPLGFALQPGKFEVRLLGGRGVEKCAGTEPHQAAVTRLARRQEHNAWALERRTIAVTRSALVIAKVDGERASNDRLDTGACELVGEFECAEQIIGIGERERRLTIGLGELGKPPDRHCALEE